MTAKVSSQPITPFSDQKPGTSGLRKKVSVFQQPHYTESFTQATLLSIPKPHSVVGAVLVIGGDGRFYCQEAIQAIIRICAGNGVGRLIIGQHGIFSTPAVSNMIRLNRATGGIILTASHNPGGPNADFGIKYNISNGGPAPESVTNAIFNHAKTLKEYYFVDLPPVDLSKLGSTKFGEMSIDIVDSVKDYVNLMKTIFDFDLIRSFLASRPSFRVLFDGMHGVTGPYARSLFLDELHLPDSSVMNSTPLPDFGGGHPDPNLTYAADLVTRVRQEGIDFGAASDGDGDRNMIIAKDCFVTPSDSVAVIAAYATEAIPYFKKTGLKGLARSMPTSAAIDRVAKSKNVPVFEVPTGWKFFGNLMDAEKLSICGEESFGTGSDHIREKDGLWAILAWLSILAYASKQDKDVSVKSLLQKHYATYGRNFFTRYDYEEVDTGAANSVMAVLEQYISGGNLVGKTFAGKFSVKSIDNFTYTDPVDSSVSANQGIRVLFEDGSRIVYRLSGTGSSGATIRIYIEKFSLETAEYDREAAEVLSGLVSVATRDLVNVENLTGRQEPTVIT